MQFIAIILTTILAAIVYGVAHDQVTARICVEYFTIGHPPVFATDNPTLLGLGWGVIATWWVGLFLGIPLAISARAGSRPKVTARQLVKPMCWMLGGMGVLAMVAAAIGYLAATRGWVWLVEPMASRVPADKHVRFLVDLWAHLTSYIAGFVGGIGLCVYVMVQRRRLMSQPPPLPR